eukprot:m51a1_g7521 putative cyclin-dependent kinase g-2-like (391) ;mRNA; r:18956-20490
MSADGGKEIVIDDDAPSERPAKRPCLRRTIRSCRSVDSYKKLNKIAEGQYGAVFKAQDKETGEIVALKKIKMEVEREGFPLTSLREIKVLLAHKHPNIVDVREVVVGNSLDHVYMAMEYVDHDVRSLLDVMRDQFLQSEVKCLLKQLLSAVAHMHSKWIIHRDLKTSNLLYSNNGYLKVADFGLAREFSDPPVPMTQRVVTLWYRAPELLLGGTTYGPAIDMWSVGCIFAEFLLREPLFQGQVEMDQVKKIFAVLGTPTEQTWPGLSLFPHASKVEKLHFIEHGTLYSKVQKFVTKAAYDLLLRMLCYDPRQRITAAEALQHAYFREDPPPRDIEMMPTWPSSHEYDRKNRAPSPDPLNAAPDMMDDEPEDDDPPPPPSVLFLANKVLNK